MIDYEEILLNKIKDIKELKRYREFTHFALLPGKLPNIMDYERNREVFIWCSNNNYLGMSLVDLHQIEAALTFACGYLANETTFSPLSSVNPGVVIFSAQKKHSLMIEGIKSGKRPKHIFRQNEVDHLEQLLMSIDIRTPKIIALESVYLMDGDVAPLEAICDLADQYNAIICLDEEHAVGMYGPCTVADPDKVFVVGYI